MHELPPADRDADEIRLDIPLDAPPWLVNREPRYVHPTLSDDELIEQLGSEIDFDLLDECLALTPTERMRRHDQALDFIQKLCAGKRVAP
ncbi:MAG TPA: hypothetical protein VF624_10440 [Tepidisphaeraceae bacterium]|jgi:hypothetical protein